MLASAVLTLAVVPHHVDLQVGLRAGVAGAREVVGGRGRRIQQRKASTDEDAVGLIVDDRIHGGRHTGERRIRGPSVPKRQPCQRVGGEDLSIAAGCRRMRRPGRWGINNTPGQGCVPLKDRQRLGVG